MEDEASRAVLKDLEGRGILDDVRFARWWAEDRALSGKYGPGRVRSELETKGVAPELIEEALRGCYPDERQREILRTQLKMGKGALARLAAKMVRNGFDEEMVAEIVLSSQP